MKPGIMGRLVAIGAYQASLGRLGFPGLGSNGLYERCPRP